MDSSSSEEQVQQRVPTSPPTNVVSVLTKMLQTHAIQPDLEVTEISTGVRKFGFYLDFEIQNKIQKCEVDAEQAMKIQQAFISALQILKKQLTQQGYDLNTQLQNYTLRLSKKNGKPKTDMPCKILNNLAIDLKQRFVDLKITSCTIQIKNKHCIKKIELVTRTQSIGSQIGKQFEFSNKEETKGDDQALRQEKKSNCMFSFC